MYFVLGQSPCHSASREGEPEEPSRFLPGQDQLSLKMETLLVLFFQVSTHPII